MSSIMGEVILHSTLEEYQDKMKSIPKSNPTYKPKTTNVDSDTDTGNDDTVIGKSVDFKTPITTTQTTTLMTNNPDNDLPTVDYKDIEAYGTYGDYDGGNLYGSYGEYEEASEGGTVDEAEDDFDNPEDIEEKDNDDDEMAEVKGFSEGEAMSEESKDADLPTFDYADLGDIYGDYGSLTSYGSYRKRRSTSRASRIEKCLDDYWERGDERCICSMIPADFYFNAEYMECRLDQEECSIDEIEILYVTYKFYYMAHINWHICYFNT